MRTRNDARVGEASHRSRASRILAGLWVVFTALLSAAAVIDLVGAIVETEREFERGPAVLIPIGAVTASVCFAALATAVRALIGRPASLGVLGGAMLTTTAVTMTLFYLLAAFALGPH